MTLEESIKICFKKYAEFSGRASRSEYWWWTLFTFLAYVGLGIFSDKLAALFSLATLLPSLAVGARRLHDTNRSGWFMFFWCLPIVGWVILIVWAAQEPKEPNQYSFSA